MDGIQHRRHCVYSILLTYILLSVLSSQLQSAYAASIKIISTAKPKFSNVATGVKFTQDFKGPVLLPATEMLEDEWQNGKNSDFPSNKKVLFVSLAIRGHAMPLLRIAKEMKARNYDVSFATQRSGEEWVKGTGARFVPAGDFPISASDLRASLQKITKDPSIFRGILSMFNDVYLPTFTPMYYALLEAIGDNPPDLIVMDIGTIGAQYIVDKLRIPYIVNCPSLMFDLEGAPSFLPAWGTGFQQEMSLWNRCMNILFPRLLSVALTPPFMHVNKIRWELNLTPFRSQHDLYRGTRIMLNTAFGLDYSRKLSPMVDMTGPIIPPEFVHSRSSDPNLQGAIHRKSQGMNRRSNNTNSAAQNLPHKLRNRADPLPPLISNWLVGSEEQGGGGVIYVNLGSMPYIEPWQAEAIVKGLSWNVLRAKTEPKLRSLVFRVIWMLPNDQRGSLPAKLPGTFRVKALGGVPHLNVLAHRSVKAVISHCGMASSQEALFFAKPVLCIPFFVDQPDVASRIVDAGAGLRLDKTRLTAEQIRDAIEQITQNETFSHNAAHLGGVLRHAGGVDRAIEIIDAALRIGFDHLLPIEGSSSVNHPWHKLAMLDVWAIYAAIACMLAVFVRVLCLVLGRVMTAVLHRADKCLVNLTNAPKESCTTSPAPNNSEAHSSSVSNTQSAPASTASTAIEEKEN